MKIKRFNNLNESINNIIEHYFINQHIEVKDLIRKQSDGKEIIINEIGIIKKIQDWDNGVDIAYEVEFPIELEHSSPYGEKWKTKINRFTIFHKKDNDKIVKIF